MPFSQKPKQKRTVEYRPEDIERALKEIRDHKKCIRETCRKYGIPRSTIQDRLAGRRPDVVKARGPEPYLGVEGEKKVVSWMLNIAKCGFPIKKQVLLDTVQKIFKDLGKKTPFKDDRPGNTWYLSFTKRNPVIGNCVAESTDKARAQVTEESIRFWFSELQSYLTEFGALELLEDANRVYNAGEMGYRTSPNTDTVLGPADGLNPGSRKDTLTVLLTLNASGQICPPLVVFPYLKPPRAVSESLPPGWCLGRSESGWMRSDVFFEYMVNDFNNWLEENNVKRPVLFLVDGYKCQMSYLLSEMCDRLGIILYALPPKTTHMLQPVDVSVFGPLKANWIRVVRQTLNMPENVDIQVNKTTFCPLFKEIISNPQMPKNIINGFRECGLHPFDPNAVEYTKCVGNAQHSSLNRQQPVIAQPATGINNQDLLSTCKVLRHLEPILQNNNIDINFILREVGKLRINKCENVFETGSEAVTDFANTIGPLNFQQDFKVNPGAEGINHMQYTSACHLGGEVLLPYSVKHEVISNEISSQCLVLEVDDCDSSLVKGETSYEEGNLEDLSILHVTGNYNDEVMTEHED